MIKILVVEDEHPISDLIKINLTDAGYDCTCVYDGMEAADILEDNVFDLVLLDIMLPKIDGLELFQYIRPMGIPVIFITAKSALDDRIKGLNGGAEDYIVKPFEIVELLARINVVLRRYNKAETKLTYHDLIVDTENKTAVLKGEPIKLTPKEFELLELFMRNVNITLFKEKIYETIWESDYYGDTRTLDLHVQRLRRKAGLGSKLKTIYKVGYRLCD